VRAPEPIARAPEPIVPVRARDWVDVRGQRVIVGRADLGWRGDLRADAPVSQDGRTFVPVLTEHDWYRAEAEQVEVFAPLVPIARVWVEATGRDAAAEERSPGIRWPRPADHDPAVTGRRVVWLGPDRAFERDLRAVGEVREAEDGHRTLLVIRELDWYRWAWTGRIPAAMEVPAGQVWIE
jgi:hypothetical protein